MTKHHEMVSRPRFSTQTWGKPERSFQYVPSETYQILEAKSFEDLYDARLRALALVSNNTAA